VLIYRFAYCFSQVRACDLIGSKMYPAVNARVLKLERIPLEILILLLEHRGEIVSREKIVARVWGNDVFLDTDNSIRGAIRKVRQALKDDSETPQFIRP
jgi:DNA-binding winged helix-turn-helix (wHTH) protein